MGLKSPPGMPPPKPHLDPPRKPAVVVQPKTYDNLKQGIDQIVDAIRPTLGPLPRLVASEKYQGKVLPEFFDDGAMIARRIIQIEPRGADVGAMLIRSALWKMHVEVGDGASTMAVIYQAIVDQGIRYIRQVGCNAMLLRLGLEKGLKAVQQSLRQDAAPLAGKENIANMARGMCQGDLEIAAMLGEIFDIVGTEGMIVVESGNKAILEREYVEGTYWNLSGWVSRLLVTDQAAKRTIFEDAALFISDLAFKDPQPLIPVLEKCAKAGIKKLVIIAKELSDSAIGLLVNNNRAKTIESLAVRTPKVLELDRVAVINDIAVLTGGRAIISAADYALEDFQVGDLGYARRAWATESQFGIYGGKGNPRLIRQHIAQVQTLLKNVDLKEDHEKNQLQERLGRLLGGTAILRLGGIVETEKEVRKGVAQRAIAGLRLALRSGVAPGGGIALIKAQSALASLTAENVDEGYAYRVLSQALEAPLRTIAENAGFQPDVIVEKVKSSPMNFGLDACTGKIIDMKQAGILDSLTVLEKAVEIAVSGAAMALTTDVIVHHRKPVETIEP